MMKWNHLPIDGGIYSQHPQFLDDVFTISQIEAKAEQERQKKREIEQKRKNPAPRGRRAGKR